jgi:hypothetical protein
MEILDEARPWLEQGLRTGLFAEQFEPGKTEVAATRAYALNALGRNHRLRYELALRAHDLKLAREHHRLAIDNLEQSLALDPYFADGWDALLAIHCQNLLAADEAPREAGQVVARLEALAGEVRGRRVRDCVRERQPEAWKGAGEEGRGNRRVGKRTKAADTRTTAA